MAGTKKPTILRQCSYNSLYSNPLIEAKHNLNCSEENPISSTNFTTLGTHLSINNKENAPVNLIKKKIWAQKVSDSVDYDDNNDKENLVTRERKLSPNPDAKLGQEVRDRILKPSSLQLCIQMNEPDSSFGFGFGSKVWDSAETESAKSVNVWDHSDSEAAPASSWSTLPNRALLCRALPMDVGRCSCIILKEAAPQGLGGGSLYSLYTNEGKGRQNRKLAVAHHRRRNGRSVFIVAQNTKGVLSTSDDSFLGLITANLMGSRYYVCDKVSSPRTLAKESKLLQAVVEFTPTISTWTGRYRSINAWIPKHQPSQLKNISNQVKHVKAFPLDWEGQKDQVHLLPSRVPQYNKMSKQYELDFREKTRAGFRILSSVKNFQLTMEGNARQTILQLGRVGKSKYVLDYRHPLTGYQAFCICLASIDPKLCCTV